MSVVWGLPILVTRWTRMWEREGGMACKVCIYIGNPRRDWIYGLESRIHQHWFQHCVTLPGGSNAGGLIEIAMVLAAATGNPKQ